jgi:hypothetical protein
MNFLLAIILVFYAVLAAPIPGLNLNFVRTDAQKLEHYDQILLKLKQELQAFHQKLQFYNLGITPLGKLQQKIIGKAVKRNKLRPANYNPPRISEFDRLYEEALDLLASLPEGRYRKDLGNNLYILLRIGRHRIAEAREHMRLMRNTFAQITPELLASGRVRPEHQPFLNPPRSVINIPANHLNPEIAAPVTNRAANRAPIQILSPVPAKLAPADLKRIFERIAGISTPGQVLPVRIKPEIVDYSEILKLATDIVTTVPQSSEYSEYLKKMLDKLRAVDSSDLKEARSQLDMIWYMVRTLVLEEN